MQNERRDAKPKWVFVGVSSLLILLVIPCLFLALIYSGRVHLTNGVLERLSMNFFPQPRVAAFNEESLTEVRKKEDRELGRYRWTDAQRTEAQVPIDRAMQIYLKKINSQKEGRDVQSH